MVRIPCRDRESGDGHVGLALAVETHHFAQVCTIEMIAGQDQHVLRVSAQDAVHLAPHRVCRSLAPTRAV